MTADELKAIRERLAKASPGPWWVDVETTPATEVASADGTIARVYRGEVTAPGPRPDADFIAHAPSDVSALLSEISRLQTELSALRAGIARVAREPTTANVAALLR